MKEKENKYAVGLKVIGWIALFIFVIIGIVTCVQVTNEYEEGGAIVLFTYSGIGIGALFFCKMCAEVIQILHDIRRKLYSSSNKKDN